MDQLSKRAMQLWPALAKQIGAERGSWQMAPLARREDARVSMIVMRLTGAQGQALVLKVQDRPQDAQGFAEAMQAHMAAHEAFPEGVPALHAVDFEAQACVMDFVSGVPLATVLAETPIEAQAGILRQAGAWLGDFHKATQGDRRVFQPKYTISYLQEVIQEVQGGKRQVVQARRFLTCAQAMCDRQPLYEGQETVAAQTHGDLHMRNVLMGQRVMGIDFSTGRLVPVGHDIGRLLSDYAILCAPHEDIPLGEVLPESVQTAFFEGYGLVSAQDPSVQLLMRHRVLAEWWGLPARAEDRSAAQERRWQGINSLVERMFPGR